MDRNRGNIAQYIGGQTANTVQSAQGVAWGRGAAIDWIMAATSSKPTEAKYLHGPVHAPVGYSDNVAWKDKIILAVAVAKLPLLAMEVIPVLKSWEPRGRQKDFDSLVSVFVSKLVRDGPMVRTKRKWQSGTL